MSLTRFRLLLEYDGGPYHGWQRQAEGPSVQAALEAAIARFAGAEVLVEAAGRTDAGVHALAMVAHVDLPDRFDADTVRDAANAQLRQADPPDEAISVLRAEATTAEFHARFSCTGRAYLYRLLDRRAPAALERGRLWHVPVPLDEAAMARAAAPLVGHHDFTSYRASECQAASPVKTLDRLEVIRAGAEIHIHAAARSFLHHQVRNLVGTLVQVGRGRWTEDAPLAALEARDRAAAGPTAPPEGLYFVGADYAAEGEAPPPPPILSR